MFRAERGPYVAFQSLSRDSGRLNEKVDPETGEKIIQFQSLSRDSGCLNGAAAERSLGGGESFNPSVGIRGV